jgi:hypothetical protein
MNRPFHRNDIDIRARQRDASYYKTGGGGRLLKEPSEATEAREREREKDTAIKNQWPSLLCSRSVNSDDVDLITIRPVNLKAVKIGTSDDN